MSSAVFSTADIVSYMTASSTVIFRTSYIAVPSVASSAVVVFCSAYIFISSSMTPAAVVVLCSSYIIITSPAASSAVFSSSYIITSAAMPE
ncbi:hypothetical protein BHE18_20520 [Rossellomorea aquimaris]|uniref:Uncharacterized protein n=1 Tax=Rossellomorea aquimaris TaxID=189382 RepID=A0A1J6WG81_9BACI|nr:hypothetical protein BHE18_20520 [Rossellomorea aquimaris]